MDKTKSKRVPLAEAAKILGVSPQCVRVHMMRGIWDLGDVVKRPGQRNNYYIYRAKLDKLIGEGKGEEEND